jgi:hypothetical protein
MMIFSKSPLTWTPVRSSFFVLVADIVRDDGVNQQVEVGPDLCGAVAWNEVDHHLCKGKGCDSQLSPVLRNKFVHDIGFIRRFSVFRFLFLGTQGEPCIEQVRS